MIQLIAHDLRRNTKTILQEIEKFKFIRCTPAEPIISILYDNIKAYPWTDCNMIYIDTFDMYYNIRSAKLEPQNDFNIIITLSAVTVYN